MIITADVAVPPPPVAVAVYVVVEVGLTDTVAPFGPKVRWLLLLPTSVTCVALVAVTVTTEELPLVMDWGLAAMVTVGADVLTVMVIVTLAEAVPPDPVAVAVYVVAEVGLTVMDPPEAATVRLLPLLPVMVIPVALVAVTVKTEELPFVIDVGLALMVTVGGDELPVEPVVMVIVTEAGGCASCSRCRCGVGGRGGRTD